MFNQGTTIASSTLALARATVPATFHIRFALHPQICGDAPVPFQERRRESPLQKLFEEQFVFQNHLQKQSSLCFPSKDIVALS